jgi:hypothetical protein
MYDLGPGGVMSVLKALVSILFALLVLAGGYHVLFEGPRPRILMRCTAAEAIEATAEFQHKTKLFFEVSQAEGVFPGVCHNFEFAPEKAEIMRQYLKTGAMKFAAYRNQTPPFPIASLGSIDLQMSNFLTDDIDSCRARQISDRTGAYELSLGRPMVEVTGIRKEGGHASVDFRWHFEALNPVGRSLPRVQSTELAQQGDDHLTTKEKSIAPFWPGSADLRNYDDGWRVVTVNLGPTTPGGQRWEYGPEWPDPRFNWGAFDESQNSY